MDMRWVADRALEDAAILDARCPNGWRVLPQMHKHIWGDTPGT